MARQDQAHQDGVDAYYESYGRAFRGWLDWRASDKTRRTDGDYGDRLRIAASVAASVAERRQ